MTGEPCSFAALSCLGDPLRRRLYEYVAASSEPVSREGAAGALGVARTLVAFHLDKLVEVGLLQVDRRRAEGRSGPGAGRPAKWYSRAPGEISVSVPERRYELAARLLAEAAARSTPSFPIADALTGAAYQHGRTIGAGWRQRTGRRTPTAEDLVSVLETLGYEPRPAGGEVTMANCPFHALAAEHPELICGMNLHLLQGLIEAAGGAAGMARLDPAPGRCCVRFVV